MKILSHHRLRNFIENNFTIHRVFPKTFPAETKPRKCPAKERKKTGKEKLKKWDGGKGKDKLEGESRKFWRKSAFREDLMNFGSCN